MRPVPKEHSELTPIEELDQRILILCTRIDAATYELLVLIRAFDERAGWLQWGLENCAEWLAWRCDLSMTSALEKVRVALTRGKVPLRKNAQLFDRINIQSGAGDTEVRPSSHHRASIRPAPRRAHLVRRRPAYRSLLP